MTTRTVTRCDGCGVKENPDAFDWWRLDPHGMHVRRVVMPTLADAAPFHFCSIRCLKEWADVKRRDHA